jgi:transposase
VAATGTTLTDIIAVGTATAAMILRGRGRAPVPDPPSLATYTGVGPIEVSSGEVERHRLSRAGNRQLS